MNREYKNSINLQFLLLPILLYFFNIRKIIFPTNFQQDDVRELFISNYQSFTCILDQGDNHPLWTYIIWFLSKVSFIELQNLVSIFNILLFIGSLFFIYKYLTEVYNFKVALLFSIFYVSAPVTLTYSISLKQYMLELFYSSYCLYISRNLDKNIKTVSFYILSFVFVIGSLVNVAIFGVVVAFYFASTKISSSNLKKLFVIFIPIIFYLNRIINNVSQEEYLDYWGNFFISLSSFEAFYNKTYFIFNMIFKSYFGFIYFDQMISVLLILLIFSSFLVSKDSIFPILVVGAFLFANILKIYPLGTGRTDIVLFPFVIALFSGLVSRIYSKLHNQFFIFLILGLVAYFSLNVDAYYKQEQISQPLAEINSADNKDTLVLIANEQYPSFEYYGQKIFGTKNIDIDGCLVSRPDFDNYLVVNKLDFDNDLFNKQLSSSLNYKRVLILGIELDSRGVFRDSEDYLISKGFFLTDSKSYSDGIYLNTYENNS